MADQSLSLKHVRRNCLDCCCDDRKSVLWCTCDGLHSTRCEFWPFRFGVQPATFRARWGDRLVTPEMMPPATVNLDNLPAKLRPAALGEINVEGYHQPAVERPELTSRLSPEERERRAEQLRRFRDGQKGRFAKGSPQTAP